MAIATTPRRALRINQVLDKVNLSKSQLYRLIQAGQFPKGVKLSERVVIFDEAAIDEWLTSKFAGGQS